MDQAQPTNAIFPAISKILHALARISIRNGVVYSAFAELSKQAFVNVAKNEFGVPNKKQTNSRIATLTGLSRKDVKAQLSKAENLVKDDAELISRYNRAARVIYGWVHDSRFCDGNGDLLDLPLQGKRNSFSALVKLYSGDMPVHAILDELLQVGVVKTTPENRLCLTEKAYLPKNNSPEKMALLGRDVTGLITTMDRNLHGLGDKPFFQRKVFYDNLPEESIGELQALLVQRGQALMEFFDKWMARHDRDANPASKGSGRVAAGIGVYYFEENVPGNVEVE
jgi:hypothetical protein